ncbi:MAG: YraN family protein [Myxococcales bacterium]
MGGHVAHKVGQEAEDLAARYFEERGYVIRERNFKGYRGEIDLVAEKGLHLVFVEVRFRKTIAFGGPDDTVDRAKQRRICHAALEWAVKNDSLERIIQFDVIAVRRTREGPRLEHIEDAFEAGM